MKKLALILAAMIIISPLAAATPALADTNKTNHSVVTQQDLTKQAFSTDQPQLKINAANSAAYLITQSGNVSVRWSKHPGAESKLKPYFISITQTHPARLPYITIATKAGRNAVIKLVHSTSKKLAAGKPGFTSVQSFVKAIKLASKKR